MDNMKKKLKALNRFLARIALKFCFFLAALLPYSVLHAFIKTVVMVLLYHSNSRLARNTRESVEIAYGKEKSASERERLVKQSFENLGRVITEDVYYIKHADQLLSRADVVGEDYLKAALAKGKGVIAVTAHFGNFPLMIAWFALQGYKVNVIMRRAHDEKTGNYIKETVGRMGTNIIFTVPVRECVQESIRVLRGNEILFVLLDQNYGADSRVFVDFFGEKAATGGSPAILASRTGAAVIPFFCTEGLQGRYRIMIEPEQAITCESGNEESLKEYIQQLTTIIEKHIRENPSLWSWMHRRWKSKRRCNGE